MKRPRQRTPRNKWGKACYFADDPSDFELIDIDNDRSVPFDPDHCAFACAWERLGYRAEVGRCYTHVDVGRFVVKYRTTALMQRQLTANDQGGTIFRGTYRLGAISPSGRKPRSQGKKRGDGGGNRPTVPVGPNLVRRRLAA